MHNRFDFGVGLIDLAMDEAFEVNGTPLRVDGIAVAVEFHDVGGGDEARRHAARQQKVLRVLIVTHTDMAKTVDHALVVEDTIGRDEIVDQSRIGRRRPGLGR